MVAAPPLRLEYRRAGDLAEHPQNWRRHPPAQTIALKAALSEVGWAGALLYNETTGHLIDGHLRRSVAQDEQVPVLVGSWTEEQERFILATLDPLGALAQTDADILSKLLGEFDVQNAALGDMLASLAGEQLPPNDPAAEWVGMPAFEQDSATGVQEIHVHFETREDVEDFAQLVGQKITPQTRYIWYPYRGRVNLKQYHVYESEISDLRHQ